jgi:hypothetical protein
MSWSRRSWPRWVSRRSTAPTVRVLDRPVKYGLTRCSQACHGPFTPPDIAFPRAHARTELLLAELAEVDGVAVEDLREVPDARAERGVDLLELLADLSLLADASEVPAQLLAALGHRFDLDWVAIVDIDGGDVTAAFGDPPTRDWLVAYAVGAASTDARSTPPARDVAIGRVDGGRVMLAGRARYELHERERRELEAVARLSGLLVPSPRVTSAASAIERPAARALDGA